MLTKPAGKPDPIARLCALQTRRRLSDRALAARLGISPAYLSYLKRGLRRPSPALEKNILAFLSDPLNFSTPAVAHIHIGRDYSSMRQQVEHFLMAKRVEGKTAATLAFYSQNLERFLWWAQKAGLETLSAITTQALRQFLSYVQSTPNRWAIGSTSSRKLPSMATVDAYWRTLQSFFTWLLREGVITAEANPMKNLLRPKCQRKVVQDIPLELIRQALALWNPATLVGARNRAILLVHLDTGIRLSECAGLGLADVNLKRSELKVLGKGQKERRVPLGKASKQALEAYLILRTTYIAAELWLNAGGRPIHRSGIQSLIRRLSRLGGNVRWSPHTFRNTFSINFLRGGGDPFSLQMIGGWEDLEMPRLYCAALKAEDAFAVHKRASPADHLYQSPPTG